MLQSSMDTWSARSSFYWTIDGNVNSDVVVQYVAPAISTVWFIRRNRSQQKDINELVGRDAGTRVARSAYQRGRQNTRFAEL